MSTGFVLCRWFIYYGDVLLARCSNNAFVSMVSVCLRMLSWRSLHKAISYTPAGGRLCNRACVWLCAAHCCGRRVPLAGVTLRALTYYFLLRACITRNKQYLAAARAAFSAISSLQHDANSPAVPGSSYSACRYVRRRHHPSCWLVDFELQTRGSASGALRCACRRGAGAARRDAARSALAAMSRARVNAAWRGMPA